MVVALGVVTSRVGGECVRNPLVMFSGNFAVTCTCDENLVCIPGDGSSRIVGVATALGQFKLCLPSTHGCLDIQMV